MAHPAMVLRRSRRRRELEDEALALLSEGLSCEIAREGHGFALCVDPEVAEEADRLLDLYEAENRARPGSRVEPLRHIRLAVAVCLSWVVFFAVTGPRDFDRVWFEQGSADAERIVAGELWRTVTAMTLHADWPHVLGNAVAGSLFFAALFQPLGPGVGGAAVLAAGALGNVANAWLRGSAHVSVGASTAVFAALGLLSALAMWGRLRGGLRGRHAYAPLAAGLALLAMLGVGARSDLGAHLFGFVAGAALGLPAGALARRPPGRPVQLVAGGAALALLGGAWLRALA